MGRSVYFDWCHVRNASLADSAPPLGSVPQVSQTVVRAVPPFVHDSSMRRQMVQAMDSELEIERSINLFSSVPRTCIKNGFLTRGKYVQRRP